MADDAFARSPALSPMAAQPSPPGEADYEAIRDAFMETARGRWFLGEYTRRNRNADTAMVLDAVARIERSLGERPEPSSGSDLDGERLRGAIAQAQTAALAAAASGRLDDGRDGARKAVRIMREIAWSLRECGTDNRICTILDKQLAAIDTLQGALDDDAALTAQDIGSAFAPLLALIGDAGTPASDDAETPVDEPGAVVTAAELPPEEAAADDAMLDLVAMEMAAPQIADDPLDAVMADAALEPDDEPAMLVTPVAAPTVLVAEAEAPSLGAALIESGLVAMPRATDPLAPFRRMTQAETIAFFS